MAVPSAPISTPTHNATHNATTTRSWFFLGCLERMASAASVEAALFIDKLVREFDKRIVGGRDLHRRGYGAERCHASGSCNRNRALAYESLCEACRCGHEERH